VCGVAGIWVESSTPLDAIERRVQRMTDALRHRGPDDEGVWIDGGVGIALGHRRLSIVDLSAAGHQPMVSSSGRSVLCYNGEIYNHRELRSSLPEGVRARLRGQSDTEVAVECIEAWGVERAVSRFVGMFAFALWERRARTLTLVRDRFGIKPMYFAETADGLAFSSELDPIAGLPDFAGDIDTDALRQYLRYGYVPAPRCIYRRARKLTPGTILTFSRARFEPAQEVRYYDSLDRARRAADKPFTGRMDDGVEALDEALRQAIELRLLADVPVGAFLSGGIDSSLVVAIAQTLSSKPLETFSIGSEDRAYDESVFARTIAEHVGTEHTSLTATAESAMSVLQDIAKIYDEPFADASQVPTLLVSRLARSHVTVALSGDGGDEVFGGYNRHVYANGIWNVTRHLPGSLVRLMGDVLTLARPEAWDALHAHMSSKAPLAWVIPDLRVPGQKAHKLGRALQERSLARLYVSLCSQWQEPEQLVPGASAADVAAAAFVEIENRLGPIEAMMLRDLQTYLPDDILTKVDRASMSTSLEARVPILDHRVVELAWSFPTRWKVHGRTGKWILRRLLSRYVPPRMFERPKSGFGLPIGEWLRGPLRPWAESMLSEEALRRCEYLDPRPIRRAWELHLTGRQNLSGALWAILSLQAWGRQRGWSAR
jgi:asparagine synthase (glutamine-hydrolysing)